jgi:hypothetical protein
VGLSREALDRAVGEDGGPRLSALLGAPRHRRSATPSAPANSTARASSAGKITRISR